MTLFLNVISTTHLTFNTGLVPGLQGGSPNGSNGDCVSVFIFLEQVQQQQSHRLIRLLLTDLSFGFGGTEVFKNVSLAWLGKH